MLEQLTSWLANDAAGTLVPSHFSFGIGLPLILCLLVLALTALLTFVLYWRNLNTLPPAYRLLLVSMRTLAITLLLFLVMDPLIVAHRVRPGEQFVALLYDDSLSMRIAGQDGRTRATRLMETYATTGESFENIVQQRHQLARFRIGNEASPLSNVDALTFDQPESDLLGGINSVLADLEGTTVSAVVLFSDGIQQPGTTEQDTLLDNLPANVPIFTVGVEEPAEWRDIELADLSLRRLHFDKSPVVLSVNVRSAGLAGREAVVEVVEGTRVVASRSIQIDTDPQDQVARLEFTPTHTGWVDYRARVRLKQQVPTEAADEFDGVDDRIAENNLRAFTIDNRKKSYRILYVSGRPNWENKYIRRALEEDEQLKLTNLIAISNAEQKFVFRGKNTSLSNPLFEGFENDRDRPRYDEAVFLRFGAKEDELQSGYPAEPEELYPFDLVIWGDVERELFSSAQLELTRDFVEKRGGALLLLGGPNSFTEGRYADTLIEAMLPVALYQKENGRNPVRLEQPFSVKPTLEGSASGAWSFETYPAADEERWNEMPPLYGFNPFPLSRPGATVMAETTDTKGTLAHQPFFLSQRYGEGTCAVLATSDTWQWQMGANHEDDSHERLWRQLIRSLVRDNRAPTLLRNKQDRYVEYESAQLEFLVRDKKFDARESLQTTLTLTKPTGAEIQLPMEESIRETGIYEAEFTPEESGLYRMQLVARDDAGEVVATRQEAILVAADNREFQNARYAPDFLATLASTTGGQAFSLDQLEALAHAIPLPLHENADRVLLHLWRIPVFFLLLVLCMIPEWYLRRRKGRA